MRATEFVNESQTAKTGIMQTDVYGSQAYHARCLEPGCDWESRRYDRIQQAQAAAKKHAATHFDKKAVAEGSMSADEYKQKLLNTIPRMMDFYEKNVKGWKPSKEQMLAAVETGYIVMKRTGDVQQAGKAVMDELNTLHKMSQGQQGVSENFADGRNPGRKGLAKRVGVNCKQPVSKLRSIAKKSSGERQRMAHWCANMKSGRDK